MNYSLPPLCTVTQSTERDSWGTRGKQLWNISRYILGLQKFSFIYFDFFPFHFLADLQSERLLGHMSCSIDPPGITGTYFRRLLYWTCHIYMHARNPSEMDWILRLLFFFINKVIHLHWQLLSLLDFGYNHLWNKRNTYKLTWCL